MSIEQGINTGNEAAEDRIHQGTLNPLACQEFRLRVDSTIKKPRVGTSYCKRLSLQVKDVDKLGGAPRSF